MAESASPAPRCLILGATGFIGGQVARAAAGRGWHVRGLRRRPGAVGAIGDLSSGSGRGLAVEWVEGNLDDCASLVAAMLGQDVVFHCAGAYPHQARNIEESTRSAVKQMRTVLAAAKEAGVRRLIYTSSYTTIGPPAEPGREADERDPYVPGTARDPYYEAKWAMEVEALRAARGESGSETRFLAQSRDSGAENGFLEVVVLCPVAVFGPGDVHLSVSQPLIMTAQGHMPFYLDATFSVVDVRDAAEAHIAAAERGRSGERYILCGHNLTMREGLAEIAAVAGVRPPFIKIGGPVLSAVIALGSLVPGSNVGYLRTARLWRPVSNAKAVRELGLRIRPFRETVADSLTWFRERRYLR